MIVSVALGTRLWHIADFPYTVFDEVYYTTMATQYLGHVPFVDTHPPTARFIFTTLAWLGGAEASDRFEFSYVPYGDFPYVLLRCASAVAGVGVVMALMLVVYELSRWPLASLMAGFLIALDNTMIISSRYILSDIFIYGFGLWGVWFFLLKERWPAWHRHWYALLVVTGVCFGLSIGTKVSGLLFPIVALGYTLWRDKRQLSLLPTYVVFLIALPALVVFLLMYTHFALLNDQGPVLTVIGNQQDPAVRTLKIFEPIRALPLKAYFGWRLGTILQITLEAVVGLLIAVAGHFVVVTAYAGSPWWAWPFMQQPFILTIAQEGSWFRVVELIGNPVVWWGGMAAMMWWLWRRLRQGLMPYADLLVAAYWFNLVAMAILPRTLYLYHYFLSLIFLIGLMGITLAELSRRHLVLAGVAMAATIAAFLFFAPLTYGWPLTAEQIAWRVWLPGWSPFSPELIKYYPQITPPS